MLRYIPAAEDASVNLRMKGLDAAVADLRESGDLADAYGLHAALIEQFLCAACGDDFPTESLESLYERNESGLVTYTN